MKPKWEKWKGEKKTDYEKRLNLWLNKYAKDAGKAMGDALNKDMIKIIKEPTEADEQEAQEGLHQHVTKRACAKCALWVPNLNDNRGQCSLSPAWLITAASHYCGSWRKEI